MSTPIKATVTLTCNVEVVINDPEVVECVTGPGGDEWRSVFYKLRTEQDIIEHLAHNCIANGCVDATSLDGWADLPASAVSMRLDRNSIQVDEVSREEHTL